MITRLFLTQLEKVINFCYKQTFFVTNGGSNWTSWHSLGESAHFLLQRDIFRYSGGPNWPFRTQLEKVIIFVTNRHFSLLTGGPNWPFRCSDNTYKCSSPLCNFKWLLIMTLPESLRPQTGWAHHRFGTWRHREDATNGRREGSEKNHIPCSCFLLEI